LGRLVKEKNPDILIDAYIRSNISEKKLVIAGSNEYLPEYVEALRELAGKNKKIIFTGAVYNNDKEILLKNCYVFCIPSSIEGLSITLLEAMSYKKAVLASDIKANREGLGDSGIWVKAEDAGDLAEKLVYCINNSGEIKRQEDGNYKRIKEKFTWNIIAKKYIGYINDIIK
jgi:glycosyltransferase involved in cell wall biosynthesis